MIHRRTWCGAASLTGQQTASLTEHTDGAHWGSLFDVPRRPSRPIRPMKMADAGIIEGRFIDDQRTKPSIDNVFCDC